ncbi:hypothetical protein PHYC_02204 [Phycisphaerales bacterium]|nr:hypothetical protein PHYC_02204 [Phycisphaerales bacterium]
MRVVAMFRVSTEKQANEGASLDAQERTYRELAAKSGWETVAEFRGCESATQASSDRRVLQQVLVCIRETEPDAIYVHEQSRLTRGDELEVLLLMRELRERRTKVIIGGVVRDLASIDERFMVGIQGVVDRAESERIKERLMRGKRERARQGKKTGGPAPFGYRNPRAGEPGRGTLVIVPEEAATVRRVFEMAATGTSTRKVADALNALGLPAPRGGQWGKTSVRRVLECPAYVGTAASGVWVAQKGTRNFRLDMANPKASVVENAHPPVIDRETWDAVRKRPRIPRSKAPRLLTGLLHVNGLRAEGNGNKGRLYYSGPRGAVGAPWLDMDTADGFVWDAFATLATGEEFVERLMREADNPTEREKAAQEIEYLDGQIERQRRRLDNLLTMRADGEITKEVYLAKSAEAGAALGNLEAERRALQAKATVCDGNAARRVVGAIRALLAGRTRLDPAQRRRVLRAIVRRIDAEAERSSASLERDERGRVVRSKLPRWTIQRVTFRLALPAESGAVAADDRAGQLATTS